MCIRDRIRTEHTGSSLHRISYMFMYTRFDKNTILDRIHCLIKNKLLGHYVYTKSTTRTQSKLYKSEAKIYAL